MIELLGVGVPRGRGAGWLLHRVCTRLQAGELTVAVSRDLRERLALLEVVVGRRLPEEGRVYLGRAPITRETRGKLRARLGEVDLTVSPAVSRTVLWNMLARRGPGLRALFGALRLPRRGERRAALTALKRMALLERARHLAGDLSADERTRLAIARELARRPEYLVVPEVDAGGDGEGATRAVALLAGTARAERLGILASVGSWTLARAHAHRVLALADGLLVFDGPASDLTRESLARRLGREPAERA